MARRRAARRGCDLGDRPPDRRGRVLPSGVDLRRAPRKKRLEARLAGVQPVTVTCDAAALDVAIEGAIDKLLRALEHRIDRNEDHKGRMPMSGPDGLSAEAEAE